MRCVGFPPFFDGESKLLILGSFPSVKSRETNFYYGHKQNRFWKILAAFFGENSPVSVEEKKSFLKKHDIALWDTVTECDIEGSLDSHVTLVLQALEGETVAETELDSPISSVVFSAFKDTLDGKVSVYGQ